MNEMFADIYNKGDKIDTGASCKNIIKNTDLRTQKTYTVSKYIDARNEFIKKIIINDSKETIEYYLNVVFQNNELTIYHEKNTYYGNYKDDEIGFHFYIDNETSSTCPIAGRLEQILYGTDSFELSPSFKYVKGNIVCALIEDESSEHLSFTESSKTVKVIVKDNLLCVDSLRFKVYLFKNPLFDNYIKNASTKDMLNCLIDYNGICDFNYDFGVGFKQIVKSRYDYKELFKNAYDINKILFSEYQPSADSLFKTFEGCFNLTDIDITLIQGSATVFTRCFANCKKLKSVKMLENRNKCRIGGIFSGCLELNKIDFPFLELNASKKWNNDTGCLTDIRFPVMNKEMKLNH